MASGTPYPGGSLSDGSPMIGLAGFATDFFGADMHSIATLGNWTQAGAGSVIASGTQENGVIVLTPNTDTLLQFRTKGLHWKLRTGKRLWWGARINLQDIDQMSWFAGLTIDDADILGSLPTDLIGFINDQDDGTIDTISRAGGTSSRTEQVAKAFTADNQWRDLKFVWNGSGRVKFYINGTDVQLETANIPTGVSVRAAFEFSAAAGQSDEAWLDYFYCWQER